MARTLGVFVHLGTAAGDAWGHDGRGPGVESELWYFPDHDICVTAYMNLTPPQANVPIPSAQLVFDVVLPLLLQDR